MSARCAARARVARAARAPRARRARAVAPSASAREIVDDDARDARRDARATRRRDARARASPAAPRAGARDDARSSRWRRLERDATTTLGTREALSKRRLGARDGGYEWLRKACDAVAENVVREWVENDGRAMGGGGDGGV